MQQTSFRTREEIAFAFEKYANVVKRICVMYMKNEADSDDILQEVFIKLMQHNKPFQSVEHEKAWLIRVAINRCKNVHKSFWEKNIDPFDEKYVGGITGMTEESDILNLVLSLPTQYKDVVYLHYYEKYSALEIAAILGKNPNAIYTALHRARHILKEQIGGAVDEYLS